MDALRGLHRRQECADDQLGSGDVHGQRRQGATSDELATGLPVQGADARRNAHPLPPVAITLLTFSATSSLLLDLSPDRVSPDLRWGFREKPREIGRAHV